MKDFFRNSKLWPFMGRIRSTPSATRYYFASKDMFLSARQKRLRGLKDMHRGERCFIIGNGPSLREMDLTLLRDEVTFGVNGIFYAFEDMGFVPTYYTVEDRLVAEDNYRIINDLMGSTKIFPDDLRYCLRPTDNTLYLHFDRFYDDYPSANFPKFSKDILRCAYWGGTVSYMNLQLAYYMGFRDVYLIGMDMNYEIPSTVDVSGTVITSRSDDVNHFHPDYFGPGKRWHYPKVDRMLQAFEQAKQVFETDKRSIYNATIGGKLDIFPRVDYLGICSGNL